MLAAASVDELFVCGRSINELVLNELPLERRATVGDRDCHGSTACSRLMPPRSAALVSTLRPPLSLERYPRVRNRADQFRLLARAVQPQAPLLAVHGEHDLRPSLAPPSRPWQPRGRSCGAPHALG